MLFIRLLAVFLVLVSNTRMLSPVRSDALRRYKRALARRADRDVSVRAGEPCSVSPHTRARPPAQHRPPAAHSSTSRRARAPPEACAGGCRFDSGLGGKFATFLERSYQKSFQKQEDEPRGVDRPRGSSAPRDTERRLVSTRRAPSPRARFPRGLEATRRSGEGGTTRWDKVSSASPAHKGQQLLHALQRAHGDKRSSAEEDSSGEVEEADASSSANSWGGPVPRAPPSWMSALYFSGHRQHLKVKLAEGVELPRATFTVELWVKPEGGQSNPAVIAGGYR